MAEPPDLAELAKRYVDLWQDHLMALAGDPALADSIARLFMAAAPWSAPPGNGGERFTAAAPGAAAVAAATLERDRRMAELARRLAALEERLAALEARLRGPGARAQRKPRRGSL
jgi:hypothetical protein